MKKIPPALRRPAVIAAVVLAAIVAVVLVRGSGSKKVAASELQVAAVEARDIALTIEATGTVEPVDLVEVKSKASGQIIRMPVEAGSRVKVGDLLAQIDTRDVKNQYDQSLASLRAAQSRFNVSKSQKNRSDDLFAQQVITAPEHESATLEYANAQAEVVRARTDLDLARQRLEDATVRAPIAGTVLEQSVSNGQVISSATSSASGGTTLLKMADLSRIRMRALVSETDIGNVRPGQAATVTVDAFPQRSFQGTVEKIEPQAVVQQSVTMFPVLISLSNDAGLLLPGMNGEVSMQVDRRDNVLAVPLDAVRTVREIPTVAAAIGLDAKKVQEEVQKQVQAQMAARGAGGDSTRRARFAAGGDTSGRRAAWRSRMGSDSTRGGRGAAWAGTGRAGGAAGGFGRGGGAGPGGASAGSGSGTGARNRAQVVFVKVGKTLEPRVVRLGLSDFDYAEVLSGVTAGEQVALLSVAEAQAQRSQTQAQIRQRMGASGTPGVGGGGGGGGRGGR